MAQVSKCVKKVYANHCFSERSDTKGKEGHPNRDSVVRNALVGGKGWVKREGKSVGGRGNSMCHDSCPDFSRVLDSTLGPGLVLLNLVKIPD